MAKITQEQLIESLKTLKEIKPNKDWAVLLKNQIMAGDQSKVVIPAQKVSFADALRFIFAQKKLVYAFSVVLLFVVGTFGMFKLLPTEKSTLQQASLTGQSAEVIKEQITITVKGLAKNLKENPVQNPQTMKILAKTLASMPGDMTTNPDVKGLMQTVVENQITDLQNTTLTDSQKIILIEAENLYNQAKYTEALESILLINN